MSRTLDNLTRDEDAYVEMMQEKQNKILQLNKELDEQQTKLDRVDKQVCTHTHIHTHTCHMHTHTHTV